MSHGYLRLNILRGANVASLLLAAVTSWAVLVVTIKTDSFFFFDGVSHVVVSLISIFLISSEIAIFDRYFAKHWPSLGPESGLVFIGVSMILIGSDILRNLREEIISERDDDDEDLGMILWHLVLVSGILISVFGLFNIIATYLFRDKAQGITARQMRMYNIAGKTKDNDTFRAFSISASSSRGDTTASLRNKLSLDERKKSRFLLPLTLSDSRARRESKAKPHPIISAPIQQKDELKTSEKYLDKTSLMYLELERPPSALHPAFKQSATPYPASSRYSVVSDMTRF